MWLKCCVNPEDRVCRSQLLGPRAHPLTLDHLYFMCRLACPATVWGCRPRRTQAVLTVIGAPQCVYILHIQPCSTSTHNTLADTQYCFPCVLQVRSQCSQYISSLVSPPASSSAKRSHAHTHRLACAQCDVSPGPASLLNFSYVTHVPCTIKCRTFSHGASA